MRVSEWVPLCVAVCRVYPLSDCFHADQWLVSNVSPRQIIQFYYMGWLTCSFFSVHWTFNVIKAYKHRICLTIEIVILTSCRSTLFFSDSCILLNLQQQYARAHIKKERERMIQRVRESGVEMIKKYKSSYEIVANEIILTFKCVYARDKLFFSGCLP